MPRGKKKVEAESPEIKSPEAKTTTTTRKPYPTYEERITAADQTIERLTKLNEERIA